MILRSPLPFQEAIDSREVKSILPTDFRTRLLDQIPPQLRERAFFSAGVSNAQFLAQASAAVDELLAGKTDLATKRLGLRNLLDSLGYRPVAGEEGTLTDLSSDRRLNLILNTNLEMAQGYGYYAQGQDSAILDQWPAQELIRVRDSKVPRDWPARWEAAGGRFYDGRMIALVNDPIWVEISRFGLPYAPFDYNSGMDLKRIDRDEAMALGLIDRDTQIAPQDRPFNDGLEAPLDVGADLQEPLLDALSDAGIVAHFIGNVLRFISGGGLGAANEFDPSQPRDADGRWSPSPGFRAGSSVKDLLYKLDQPEDFEAPVHRLGDREAARIKHATGRDVRGYYHTVNTQGIRHSRKNHPEISDQDWQQIGDTLGSPDEIHSSRTAGGEPAIEFHRREGDSSKLIVSVVRRGQRKLAVKTFKRVRLP